MMKRNPPIEEGDFYMTPQGYRRFTEKYHLKRGYCCESTVSIAPMDTIHQNAFKIG